MKYSPSSIDPNKLITLSISGDEKSYDFTYKVPYWEANTYQKNVFIELNVNQQMTGSEKLFVYIDHMFVTDPQGYNLLKRNSTSKTEYIPL